MKLIFILIFLFLAGCMKSPTKIPFEIVGSNKIVFPVCINGIQLNASLDTGGKGVILDEEYSHLGVKVEGKKAFVGGGIGEQKPASFFNISKIEFGNLNINNTEVLSYDFSSIFNVQDKIQVNVGSKFLKANQLILIVNYKERYLQFTQEVPPKYHSQMLPFLFHKNTILIKGQINGKLIRNVYLDTGAGMSSLSLNFLKDITYKKNKRRIKAKDSVGNVFDVKSISTTGVRFSNLRVANADFFVRDFAPRSKHMGFPISGIIGSDLLKDSILILDFKNEKFLILD